MKAKQIIGAGALLALLLTGCGAKPAEESGAPAGASPSANTNQGQWQGGDRPAMNQGLMQMNLMFQTLVAMDKADGLAITKDQAELLLPIVQESIANNELSSDNKAKLTGKLTAEQKAYLEDSEAKMQERISQGRQGGQNGDGAPGGQDGQNRQGGPRGQGAPGGGQGGQSPQGAQSGGQGGQSPQGAQSGGQDRQNPQGAQGGGQGGQSPQGAQGGGPRGQGGQGGGRMQGAPGGEDGQNGQGAPGGRGGFGGFGGGMNAGQQLVELLQSK